MEHNFKNDLSNGLFCQKMKNVLPIKYQKN